MPAIKRAVDGGRGGCGARKVWHQLRRGGHDIARRTVERLMKVMGSQGVVRGRKAIATNPDAAQPCPDDKVNRAFVADVPYQPWFSDFTRVSSWQGMVCIAVAIDVFARKIVGWRVSTSMTTGFVLDAQYLSIRCAERLAEAGFGASVGAVGEPCDNALAQCIIGLFQTEAIKSLGRWKSIGQVERETPKRADWHDHTRLHSAIGYVAPNEAEEALCARENGAENAA